MRALRITIGTVLVMNAFVSSALALSSDVIGTPYELSANALEQAGIIKGYDNGQIGPFDAVTRAQAIKMLVLSRPDLSSQVQWYSQHPSPVPLFRDTHTNAWYAPYLEVAYKHRIIEGHSDGTFRPHEAISAGESIAMIVRTLGSERGTGAFRTSEFLMNEQGQWFTPYVSAALEKNLIMKGQRISVSQLLSRGQFFDVLYRMREVNARSLTAYNGPEPMQSLEQVAAQPALNAMQTTYQATPAEISQYLSKKSFAITIPALGITDLTITTPSDPFSSAGVLKPLATGLGHLFSTPGQNGKILIYGHSSSTARDTSQYTKIFRKINKLKPGDRVYVTHAGRLYIYEITGHKTVAAKDTKPYQPDGSGEQLILYTCWPPDSISQRFLQFGRLVQTVAKQ